MIFWVIPPYSNCYHNGLIRPLRTVTGRGNDPNDIND